MTDKTLLQLHVSRAIALAAVKRAKLIGSTQDIAKATAAAHKATHDLMKYEGTKA